MQQPEKNLNSPEHLFPFGELSRLAVESVPLLNTDEISLRDFLEKLKVSLLSKKQVREITSFYPIEVIERAQLDIGMIVSALNYKGLPVSSQFPDLIELLLELAKVTGLPPRECKHAYSYSNAIGSATRSYTNDPEELALIQYDQDFARKFSVIISGINRLLQATDWEEKPHLTIVVREVAKAMNETATIMLNLRKNVSPEFFDRRRKFATKQLILQDPLWKGPEGEMTAVVENNTNADFSIAMIDILLYGADESTQRRITPQLVFFPTRLRDKFLMIFEDVHFASLKERVIAENLPNNSPLLGPLADLFKGMWRWRTMHNSAVTTHLRMQGKGANKTGAGYEYDEFLTSLIDRSESAYREVKKNQ